MFSRDQTLRKAVRSDCDQLYELLCVPEVFHYLADGAAPSRTVAESWIEENYRDDSSSGIGLWILETSESEAIGCVLIQPLE
jgi:RimJ/RimL family protein N-acetyltransferase